MKLANLQPGRCHVRPQKTLCFCNPFRMTQHSQPGCCFPIFPLPVMILRHGYIDCFTQKQCLIQHKINSGHMHTCVLNRSGKKQRIEASKCATCTDLMLVSDSLNAFDCFYYSKSILQTRTIATIATIAVCVINKVNTSGTVVEWMLNIYAGDKLCC